MDAKTIKDLAEAYAASCELYARDRTWKRLDKEILEKNALHKAIDAMQAEIDRLLHSSTISSNGLFLFRFSM